MESEIISNSSSVQSLCRVCLSSSDDNKCIFTLHKSLDHENYSFTDLLAKLKLYGGIEVARNDGFPGKICNECISKMRVAHCFRIQCQETDKILRSAYKNDGNIRYWMKAENDSEKKDIAEFSELQKFEEIGGDDFENLKDIDSDKITGSPAREIIVAEHLSKKSEKTKSSIDSQKLDDALVSKKTLYRSRKKLLAKKINSNEQRHESWRVNNEKTKDCKDIEMSGCVSGESNNDQCNDTTEEKEETPQSKKEAYRSRRFVVFKRMTSMQSLKDRKEQQRQYIKKTLYAKHDGDNKMVQTKKYNCNEQEQFSDNDNDVLHKCYKSGKPQLSETFLKTHELNHENETFPCTRCEQIFCRLEEFLEHGKLHEKGDKLKPVICTICNKNFRKSVTMVRHLNVHKRDNPRAVYSILKDIREKRKIRSIDASIESGRDFDSLEKKLPSNIGKCTAKLQGDTFEVYAVNDNDQGTFDNSCIFYCEQCGQRYSDKDALRKHSLSHEDQIDAGDAKIFEGKRPKSRIEACDPAQEKTHQNSRLHHNSEMQNPPDDRSAIKIINIWIKEELDSDNEGKGFPCRICNKSYVTKKSLLKHRAKVHENQSDSLCSTCQIKDCTCVERIKESREEPQEKSKTHTCEECNKTFEKETKLEKHMRIHARAKEQQDTNFKRFLCHICSKTFRQNTGLMFHMRTHTGYKPHVCKYCGRGFTSNSNCINHERTHTGDRPFVCHFCSAAFAKSCTLKAHITTHTGEANYHCKTCGKSFRRLKYLKEHRFTHTGEKPYACKICGTAYSHSGSLFVHEKKCKAQHGNYQTLSVPVSQNYCQNQSSTMGESSVAIPPIIGSLTSTHDINTIDNPLSRQENKNYAEGVAAINTHCMNDSTGAQVHSNTMNPGVPTAVRSFTIISQMFHT